MRNWNLWAVAVFCGVTATFAVSKADPIQVNKWPDDVPCSALSKNGDGTFTLLQSVVVGTDSSYAMDAGNTFPTSDEYHIWAVNCGG